VIVFLSELDMHISGCSAYIIGVISQRGGAVKPRHRFCVCVGLSVVCGQVITLRLLTVSCNVRQEMCLTMFFLHYREGFKDRNLGTTL